MKLKILIFLLVIFASGCMSSYRDWDLKSELKPRDQLMYAIIDLTAKQVYRKFGITCYGEGAAVDDKCKLKEIIVRFQITKPIGKDDGAKMILSIVKMLLENVNNNSEIKSYLCCQPFTIHNLNLGLLTSGNQSKRRLYAISFSRAKMRYFYDGDSSPMSLTENNEFYEEESYEDVLQRLNIPLEDQLR